MKLWTFGEKKYNFGYCFLLVFFCGNMKLTALIIRHNDLFQHLESRN